MKTLLVVLIDCCFLGHYNWFKVSRLTGRLSMTCTVVPDTFQLGNL